MSEIGSRNKGTDNDAPQPVKIDDYLYIYRGFTIHKTPGTRKNGRRYLITWQESYLGQDFAITDACQTINRIASGGKFISVG